MIEVLIKGVVGLIGHQGRDHPEHSPERPKAIDVFRYISPAYGIYCPETPIPLLASCVILFAFIQHVLVLLEIQRLCDLEYLRSLLLAGGPLALLLSGESPS